MGGWEGGNPRNRESISAEPYVQPPLLKIIQFGWGLIRHSVQFVSGTGACGWFAIQIYYRGKECLEITSILSHVITACTRTIVLYFLVFRFVLMLVRLRTVTVGLQSESISWQVGFLHYRYKDAFLKTLLKCVSLMKQQYFNFHNVLPRSCRNEFFPEPLGITCSL